jgi:hypothetical protein
MEVPKSNGKWNAIALPLKNSPLMRSAAYPRAPNGPSHHKCDVNFTALMDARQ